MAAAVAERQLEQIWETHPKRLSFFVTVDHKKIGEKYLVTAFTFFVLGGIEALLLRTQLMTPENKLLDPETYNQLFSMHGTTMIFLFSTPILSGFGNYFVPLLLGARDQAFPRLNAFSYWIFLASGLFMYASFLVGEAPDGGWFAYTPMTSSTTFSPGLNIDFWGLGLIFLGISSTVGALNFIVTILKLRAPGMSLDKMPLFLWNVLVTAFAIIFALPALTVALVFLELDRRFGTRFFDPSAGGNPLLWQHLFWFFGHPDVYIIFLPAVGIVSTVVATFSRRPLVGYALIALATISTGFLAFGVWLHHMFATGLPALSLSFFSAASSMIAIPAGVQMIAWISTIWSGRPVWNTSFLFSVAFLVLFLIGGLSGVMFAVAPFDQQATDTYFVVAHFHYVLFGGAVFPIFSGLYYWLPKISGRLLDERLGQVNFWLVFAGFNLTFFPMHITGLVGMPRRVYTYPEGLGWDGLNMLSTIGSYVLALGILAFIVNFFWSRSRGAPAGDDPWGAGTLEWAISSPPPPYNFRTIPIVDSAYPLWAPTRRANDRRLLAQAEDGQRETLGTTVFDGDPQAILNFPEDSPWPLLLALCLSVLFVGLLLGNLAAAIIGGLLAFGAAAGWLWPGKEAQA